MKAVKAAINALLLISQKDKIYEGCEIVDAYIAEYTDYALVIIPASELNVV